MNKKIFIAFVFLLLPSVGYSGYYDLDDSCMHTGLKYKITDTIKKSWGSPIINKTYIQDKTGQYAEFRIKEGWSCCGGDSAGDASKNNADDQAIIAFVANNITEHGAEFCLTQIYVASSSSGFYMRFQQPNWPGLQCAWFCEPGWDGTACTDKTSEGAACNTTDYKSSIQAIKSRGPYSGNDSIRWNQGRMGVAEYVTVLDQQKINNFYPHKIIIGATQFNAHGIEAEPILLGAVGNHPIATVLTSQKAASGIKKVLCAQGFTRDDKCNVSSKNCGSDIFCTKEDEKNFSSKKGHAKQINGICTSVVCADGSKGLDSSYNCVSCGDTIQSGKCSVYGNVSFGKCIKCAVGQYFDATDCTCKEARKFGTDALKYGNNKTEAASLQCWSLEDFAKYKECVVNTSDVNNTSSAVDKW